MYIIRDTVNPYEESKDNHDVSNSQGETKIVLIKILDVLFDEKVCNLVYMQDLTKLYLENEQAANSRENIQIHL